MLKFFGKNKIFKDYGKFKERLEHTVNLLKNYSKIKFRQLREESPCLR